MLPCSLNIHVSCKGLYRFLAECKKPFPFFCKSCLSLNCQKFPYKLYIEVLMQKGHNSYS